VQQRQCCALAAQSWLAGWPGTFLNLAQITTDSQKLNFSYHRDRKALRLGRVKKVGQTNRRLRFLVFSSWHNDLNLFDAQIRNSLDLVYL